MKSKTWVVVADEAIARILQRGDAGNELEPVEELTDPDAHAAAAEMRRDSYGRRAASSQRSDSPGDHHRLRSGASVTSSAGEAEQHQEADRFARRVAARLDEAQRQDRFDALYLVAAPRFLGFLRKHLSKQVADAVKEELDKDLIHADNAELAERLFARGATQA